MTAENTLELVRANARMVENALWLILVECLAEHECMPCHSPAGGMYIARFAIIFPHCIISHLERALTSPIATSG